MIITSEQSLHDFDFWGGAQDLVDALTVGELDKLEGYLEAEYPNGIDETDLNDLFRYEGDLIAQWLGYEDEDALINRYLENADEGDEYE